MNTLFTRVPLLTTLVALAVCGASVGAAGQTSAACEVPPPRRLAASVDGLQVTLTWQPVPGTLPTRYSVEMGNAAGSTYLGTTDTDVGQTTFTRTLATGVYFVRIRAANSC